MAPKKEVKQEIPQDQPVEVPKQVDPEIQEPQEGFGRFEYSNGTVYEGQWRLYNSIKMKDGEGTLTHPGSTSHDTGNEKYEGSWKEDQMNGFGVYQYTSGARYEGQWLNGKMHGQGVYEFADGSIYEGQWSNHKMHGEGNFIDKQGQKWEGEFVEGVYQSKNQKMLKQEKIYKKKEQEILSNANQFFPKFTQLFAASDKKTYKDNLSPLFANPEEIKIYVSEPYTKFEDKQPQDWNDIITQFQNSNQIKYNVLRQNMQAVILECESILQAQMNGVGQIVEFQLETDLKTMKLALCNQSDAVWVITLYQEA